MNPYSGHLVALTGGANPALEGYELVPKALQHDAERELAGRNETHVNLKAAGPLQAWAKKKRKQRAAAKSRRINRER